MTSKRPESNASRLKHTPKVLRQAINADRGDLATKADIAALEGRIHRTLWMQGAAVAGLCSDLHPAAGPHDKVTPMPRL